LNYGLNKIRFTSPVRSGSRVRGRFMLAKVDDIDGGLQLTCHITLEIEGHDRPALVAESIVRRYLAKGARMRAVMCRRFGPPEKLEIEDMLSPVCIEHQNPQVMMMKSAEHWV
jgi:hypothetical protein